MGAALSAIYAWRDKTGELIKVRRECHEKKAREEIITKLKAIETKKEAELLHDPVYPLRPYGLPEGMEGAHADVWDLIFQYVDDLDVILSLREVCQLFRERLKRKYVQARMPEVIRQCLERKLIPWRAGRTERNNWLVQMSSLRVLSRATKVSVNRNFDRGLLGEEYGSDFNWFYPSLFYPNYVAVFWQIPVLKLGALHTEQRRLKQALKFLETQDAPETLRAVIFNEQIDDGVAPDLATLRNDFHSLLEKIGGRVISFEYRTLEGPSEAYSNLRRFVALMPNLEEVMIDFLGPRPLPNGEVIIDPFPACKNLKRYAEGPEGFSFPYLKEIFKRNPQIEGVQLGQNLSANRAEMRNIKNLLDTLHLKSFHCTSTPLILFFNYDHAWGMNLHTLVLWDTRLDLRGLRWNCSKTLLRFVSSFDNLKNLYVSSYLIWNTGGYLNLPNLETVYWNVSPDFKTLEFLKPVERLRHLAVEVHLCPELHARDDLLRFLGEWNVPTLFPALKDIKYRTDLVASYQTVWEYGVPNSMNNTTQGG